MVGRVAATGDYESISWIAGRRESTGHPDAEPIRGIIIYRLAAPLVFSNAEAFKQTGKQLLIDAAAEDQLPHTMILDCEEISFIDTTGAAALHDLHAYLRRYGVVLAFARLHSAVDAQISRAGVSPHVDTVDRYATVRGAVIGAERHRA